MCSELWRRGCVCRQPPTFGWSPSLPYLSTRSACPVLNAQLAITHRPRSSACCCRRNYRISFCSRYGLLYCLYFRWAIIDVFQVFISIYVNSFIRQMWTVVSVTPSRALNDVRHASGLETATTVGQTCSLLVCCEHTEVFCLRIHNACPSHPDRYIKSTMWLFTVDHLRIRQINKM